MARQPRFALPGYPQHVIQRGNNRAAIFSDAADHLFYLDKLADACERFECRIHAYMLMTNHAHLLITPATQDGIGKVMQSLGRSYVQHFNYRHGRTGTLREGRYKASLLDTETYLLVCYRYIELNPVRAGMVEQPGQYRWSSYHFNALAMADPIVTPHELYLQPGSDTALRCDTYRALFTEALSTTTIDTIRAATNHAWAMGNNRFRAEIRSLLKRPVEPERRGGDRKSTAFRQQRRINRV